MAVSFHSVWALLSAGLFALAAHSSGRAAVAQSRQGADAGAPQAAGLADVEPSIVGKPREARPGEQEAVVFLQFLNYTSDGRSKLCTGTLISRRTILTAGHCLFNKNSAYSKKDYAEHPDEIVVWTGVVIGKDLDPDDPRSGKILVKGAQAAKWHPRWQGGGSWDALDMGLILLPAGVADHIQPYRIARGAPEAGQKGLVVGYGSTGQGKGIAKNIGNTRARGVNDRIIAIGGESSICTGDSGGPLLIESAGVWEVAGTASRTTFDCDPGSGSMTRVDSQAQWIDGVASEWEKAAGPGAGAGRAIPGREAFADWLLREIARF
ncbi:MAG: trypsin-like serine protease [Elusimicrobia bacterium]|nr:trypsin-like serine protease [Elusimicrobiota bacterium]